MNIGSIVFVLILMLSSCKTMADDPLDSAIETAFSGKTDLTIQELVASGVWGEDKEVFLIYEANGLNSLLYVFIHQNSGQYLPVNLSYLVNSQSNGKLGRKRTDYDKYQQEPLLWQGWSEYVIGVSIKTRAWKDGQRYTVENKPMLIKQNGEIVTP